jgi:hypothetical protein
MTSRQRTKNAGPENQALFRDALGHFGVKNDKKKDFVVHLLGHLTYDF